jgi:organic hydroperoxide reductase OsmC/OhrA
VVEEVPVAKKEHHYEAEVRWTGARQGTTSSYRAYSREYAAVVEGKPTLRLTADSNFLGDESLHNPEDLLVISLSGCHLLTYLSECARRGLHVLSYVDEASGTIAYDGTSFRFTEVVLRPRVVIAAGGDRVLAEELHHRAHELCFVARSVNFPVRHEPVVTVDEDRA